MRAIFHLHTVGALAIACLTLAACQTASWLPAISSSPPDRLLAEAGAIFDAYWRPSAFADIDNTLPLYRIIERHPLDFPRRAYALEQTVRAHANNAHGLMQLGFNLGGIALFRPATAVEEFAIAIEQTAQKTDAVSTALKTLADAAGASPSTTAPSASIPSELGRELANLLLAIARAERYRQRAFSSIPAELSAQRLVHQVIDGKLEELNEPDFRSAVKLVEFPALAAGMLDLVAATERMVQFLRTAASLPKLNWQVETPLGRIVIDTTDSDNQHDLDRTLLIIDTGGNDQYLGGLPTSVPIQVLIDTDGNDCYSSGGGALLGYSVLWDAAGDDQYGTCASHDRPLQLTQAAALFGAALLIDEQGNDTYKASSHAQAWALAGSALLIDRQGHDTYWALGSAQGSAHARGTALLVDSNGNDHYILAATPVIHPATQLPDRNVSIGQGAGIGLRAEFTDGRSLPGGFGALIDLAGDDRYQAQVFAQGAGYYYGIGALIDGAGNDDYQAAWYAMGASAHNAAGIMIDRGADNDRYTATQSTAIAAAHDRSIAWFIDEGGDDEYLLDRLSLGAAHDNGIAIFADLAGADHYLITSNQCLAFGVARLSMPNGLRASLPNIGLFFDLSGQDDYPKQCVDPANDHFWQSETSNHPAQFARGLDGEHASAFLSPGKIY